MPRTLDYSKVELLTVKRKATCNDCKTVLTKGMKYIKVGSKKFCEQCFVIRKEKALKSFLANKVYELQPYRRCPVCNEEKELQVINFKVAENKEKGLFVFTYQCKCGVQFQHQKDI